MSASPDLVTILGDLGRELRPDEPACACHAVPRSLCPARPATDLDATGPIAIEALDPGTVARAMLAAGANRIGTSSGVRIVKGARADPSASGAGG